MKIDTESNTIHGTYQEYIDLMYYIKLIIQHSGYSKHEFYDENNRCITLRVVEKLNDI